MEEDQLWSAYRNAPSEKEKGKLREPAQAVAVSKCLLHRLVGERKGDNKLLPWDMHPSQCNMCGVPSERLWPMYEEWMEWSHLNTEKVPLHPSAEAFFNLPREVQRQEVRKAQGYTQRATGRKVNSREVTDGGASHLSEGEGGTGSSAPQGVAEDDGPGVSGQR